MASIGTSGKSITQKSKLAFIPHILITLPERALDFVEKKVVDISYCEMLILDEADKLPAESLEHLVRQLPLPRQSLVFFDRFTSEIAEFVAKHLDSPFEHDLKKVSFFRRD